MQGFPRESVMGNIFNRHTPTHLETAMAFQLRILHISDLHERVALNSMDEQRKRKIRVMAPSRYRVLEGSNGYEIIRQLGSDRRIDLVCFTGDIADWGLEAEYAKATQRIDNILSAAGATREQLYLVPGNHDVCRNIEPESWRKLRDFASRHPVAVGRWLAGLSVPDGADAAWLNSLGRTGAFWNWVERDLGRAALLPAASLHKRLGYSVSLHLRDFPFPVHIIGLDTAWLAGNNDDARKLRLTDDQINLLARDEDGAPLKGFRLALMHHPLGDLADEQSAIERLSETTDLLLHGHQHQPINEMRRDPDRSLLILAAGSLYEGDEADHWINSFHAIDVDLDDRGRPLRYQVSFFGWSPRGHWYPSGAIYKSAPQGLLTIDLAQSGSSEKTTSWDLRPLQREDPAHSTLRLSPTHETLHDEIRSGNTGTVQRLLRAGLSTNRVLNGITPLDLVLSLIDAPPSIAVPDPQIWVAMLKILLEAPDPPRGSAFAVHAALSQKATSRFVALLRAGVGIDCLDAEGHSLAARAMRIDAAATSDTQTQPGWTELLAREAHRIPPHIGAWMLCWGASRGHRGLVEYVLSKGIRPDTELTGAPQEDLEQGETEFWWPGGTALHFATGRWPAIVRHLLKRGAAPNAVDKNGRSPLHLAAAKDDEGALRVLLEQGADSSKRDIAGKTALMLAGSKTRLVLMERTAVIEPADVAILVHDAVTERNDQFLKSLLEKGADPNVPLDICRSPLFRMAYWWRHEPPWKRSTALKCIDVLLAGGADVGLLDSRGQTVLHQFVQNAEPEAVEKILAAGADPNHAAGSGETPLMFASTVAAADLLISNGASLTATDRCGQSSVDHMAIYSRVDLIEWFAARGARPSRAALLIGAIIGRRETEALSLISAAETANNCELVPLNMAARYCLPNLVEALLDRGADINHRSSEGNTPLGECLAWFPVSGAIQFKEWDQTARLLLKRGASVEAVDAKGNPAIFVGNMLWHWSNPSDLVRLTFGSTVADQLMRRCIGLRSAQGKTVLMAAAARGFTRHVKAALQQPVGLEETDAKQRTALFECCSTPLEPVEKSALLISAGASPDARDNAGETPLFEAARNQQVAVLRQLIEAGANVDAVNAEGETPLFAAARHNYPQNARSLLEAGARTEIRNCRGDQAIDIALQSRNPELINLFRGK